MINIRKATRSVVLFLLITLAITTLWFAGFEVVYARVLVFTTNTTLTIAGSESQISVNKNDDGHFFKVQRLIDGRRANYPQKFENFLLPAVMVFAWLIFSAFYRQRKHALKSAGITAGVFIALQTVFLLLLTVYYTSNIARYIYDIMLDSFYIIAMGIIIIDYIRHPIALKKKTL